LFRAFTDDMSVIRPSMYGNFRIKLYGIFRKLTDIHRTSHRTSVNLRTLSYSFIRKFPYIDGHVVRKCTEQSSGSNPCRNFR